MSMLLNPFLGSSEPVYTSDVKFAVIDFTSPGSTGSQGYTSTDLDGDSPKAYQTMASVFQTSDDAAGVRNGVSWGLHQEEATDDVGHNTAIWARHNLATTDTGRGDLSGLRLMSAGSVLLQISNVDDTPGGVSLNWTNVTTTNARGASLAFSGVDLQAHEDIIDPNRATLDVTGPGFEPDIVMFLAGSIGVSSSNGANINIGIAVNDGSDTQRGLQVAWLDAQAAGDSFNVRYANRIWPWYSSSVGYKVGTFDASGFTVSHDGTSNGFLDGPMSYLALKVGDRPFALVDFSVPGSTGVEEITCGFRPRMAILVMTNGSGNGFGYCMVTENNSWSHSAYNLSGADPTSVKQSFKNVAALCPDASGPVGSVGDFNAFTATGLEIDWTAVSGGGGFALLVG